LHITEVLRTDLGCHGIEQTRILRPLISICGKYVDLHRPRIDALAKALLADGIVNAKGIRGDRDCYAKVANLRFNCSLTVMEPVHDPSPDRIRLLVRRETSPRS
jgi:hypothetical protein